jgi:putative FmdB family regulatory protein
MPTYDYECDACDHKFELYQSITADPEKKCPKCKKMKLRRLIGTGAAVVFKGSGFYQTDYRSESYKKSAAADSKAPASETKSESTTSTETNTSESPATKAADPKPASTESSPKTKGKGKGKKAE